MPKIIDLKEMDKLIKEVRSRILTSNDIVDRIKYPYYHAHQSVPESLTSFKKILTTYRKEISDQIDEIDRSGIYKDFLSPHADYNNLSNGSFFHSIVLHLTISKYDIGDCGECTTQLAVNLTKSGYNNVAFIAIKFDAAKSGMETCHQFLITNLGKIPSFLLSDNISIEKLFLELPKEAVIGDAFLGISFYPSNIPALFKSYITAYGGKATVVEKRHFYNLSGKSFDGYLDIASQLKILMGIKKSLPDLKNFSSYAASKKSCKQNEQAKNPEAKTSTDVIQNALTQNPERVTVKYSSDETYEYLTRLDNYLRYAGEHRIVEVDAKSSTVSFPIFWLKQLGSQAIGELSQELKVSENIFKC